MNFVKETLFIDGINYNSRHKETAVFFMRRDKNSNKWTTDFTYKDRTYYISCQRNKDTDDYSVVKRCLNDNIQLFDITLISGRQQELCIVAKDKSSYLELQLSLVKNNKNYEEYKCNLTVTEWEVLSPVEALL